MTRTIFLYFLTILFAFTACTQESIHSDKPLSGDQVGYLQIYLDMPEMEKAPSTKAMNDEAEKKIDISQLNLLVFSNHEGEDIFAYRAPVSGEITYDTETPNRAMLTVQLAKSEAGEKFRIVVLAKHDLSSVSAIEGATRKSELLEQLTFSATQWNAASLTYTPFPMWGESELLEITETMNAEEITLYRALAKIDVGLNFRSENGSTETAEGLNHFSLKEIKVYRTYTQGTVVPKNGLVSTEPNIPEDAVRNPDSTPISYTIDSPTGASAYTREIYIPEVDLPESPQNDNMHCLVVGGFYKGSTTISYYRLDFVAEADESGDPNYLPVLRNHHYIFNITAVRGPGYRTPESALESKPSPQELECNLLVWDETINSMEVQGKYYFGLDQQKLLFAPQATETAPSNIHVISYQTNYPLSASSPLTLEWANQTGLFQAVWEETTNEIVITTLTENNSNTIQTDVLQVKAGNFIQTVLVEQNYINYNYSLICDAVSLNGTYISGTTLNATEHYIDLTLEAEDRSIEGKKYHLETEDMSGNHGVSFQAEGVFDFTSIPEGQPLTVPVRMTGSGTLNLASGNDPFTLRIKSNSSTGSYCKVTLSPVARKISILVLGSQSKYGYNIAIANTGANKVLTSANNFGPHDYSIVKTAGVNLINANLNADNPNTNKNLETIKSWLLTGEEKVDILYISHDVYIQTELAGVIAEYLNNQGVVICFLEGNGGYKPYTSANLMNACFGVSTITQEKQSPAGLVYELAGDPEAVDDLYLSDPILNGPFGDVRKKPWGEDASYCALLEGMPMEEIIVYSNGVPLNRSVNEEQKNKVSGFRHKTKNLVYFGDGGFTSSGTDGRPNIYNNATICPFNWDETSMFPIPHPTYGSSSAKLEVYNSHIWCNIMAWAVDRAINNGINSNPL